MALCSSTCRDKSLFRGPVRGHVCAQLDKLLCDLPSASPVWAEGSLQHENPLSLYIHPSVRPSINPSIQPSRPIPSHPIPCHAIPLHSVRSNTYNQHNTYNASNPSSPSNPSNPSSLSQLRARTDSAPHLKGSCAPGTSR